MMPTGFWDLEKPGSLSEALSILHRLGERAKPLAGGTDLLLQLRRRKLSADHLVSLQRIGGLDSITRIERDLHLGALVTMDQMTKSGHVGIVSPSLAMAAGHLGSRQIRSVATVGGNLCNGSPSAETAPVLLVHDASVTVASLAGTETIPINAFFYGPGQTALHPGQIVTGLVVPSLPSGARSTYVRYSLRRGMDTPVVNMGLALLVDGNGRIEEARIALGAVGPTPLRAHGAEKTLCGNIASTKLIQECAEVACLEARPISDVRASAAYRLHLVKILLIRALSELCMGELGGPE